MDQLLQPMMDALGACSLPVSFSELFGACWDEEQEKFVIQETYIIDFKDKVPSSFSKDYGAGIIRLALGFHNSFGGLIVFGVRDKTMDIIGEDAYFPIEAFNSALSDFSATVIECISRQYEVTIDGGAKTVSVVLVPKRETLEPVRLTKPVDKYEIGTLWLRERHEVVRAKPHHLPFLFSARELEEPESEARFPVHRSFPPSPATLEHFVPREELLEALWKWFVLGDKPRLYLHGPGGSGKSTLAFRFAKAVAENGFSVRGRDGDRVDYVIFISAKETEFLTVSATIEKFALQQFTSKEEQFQQIVYHSGLSQAAYGDESASDIDVHLSDLFDNFCGLVVLDDIDTLSRNGKDTGEEELFIKLLRSKKRNKILYTLRFPPSHALNSSQNVPGLDFNTEFFEFISECCQQFGVISPKAEEIPKIAEVTSRLPLLIETIIGLRKYCSNYSQSIALFQEKGGEDARRYIYQREYDRLKQDGKARHLLCALLLIEEPVSFKVLSSIFVFPREQILDAIAEARSIFLSSFENVEGETLYQLTPPAVPFINTVSRNLFYYNNLHATVMHFKSEGLRSSSEDASIIVSFERSIRQHRFDEIIAAFEKIPAASSVAANPRIKSLAAQAYSEAGPANREKARELFKQSFHLGYIETFMMRRWYNMEIMSGYGLAEAEAVCTMVIDSDKSTPRARSEFWSKRGSCLSTKASTLVNVNKDKAFATLRESVLCYLEGLWMSRSIDELDSAENLVWLERPLGKLAKAAQADLDQFFLLFEQLSDQGHDVDEEGAEMLIRYMGFLPVPKDLSARKQLRGICSRVIAKISRTAKNQSLYPGLIKIRESLEYLRAHFAN